MKYNDFELLSLIQDGNQEALEILYNKYRPIIIRKSEKAIMVLSHHGIEISDIMQEGYIALDRAIKYFNDKDEASFYTFALICIDRQISNFIKKNLTTKSKVLNEAVEIDNHIESTVPNNIDMESTVISDDCYDYVIDKANKTLTDFERKVFWLKMENYSNEEIAKKLDKDIKAIYNTIQRIKNKLRKYIDIDL